MRYAGAGNKMVQSLTMEEKSSFFGMLDRIEKVVNDTYCREAMPTLVKGVETVSQGLNDVKPQAQPQVLPQAPAAMQEPQRRVANGSNVIDVASLVLARGESAGTQSNIIKMGDDVILEKKAVGGEPVINRFPPEFYDYFEIVEIAGDSGPTPSKVA